MCPAGSAGAWWVAPGHSCPVLAAPWAPPAAAAAPWCAGVPFCHIPGAWSPPLPLPPLFSSRWCSLRWGRQVGSRLQNHPKSPQITEQGPQLGWPGMDEALRGGGSSGQTHPELCPFPARLAEPWHCQDRPEHLRLPLGWECTPKVDFCLKEGLWLLYFCICFSFVLTLQNTPVQRLVQTISVRIPPVSEEKLHIWNLLKAFCHLNKTNNIWDIFVLLIFLLLICSMLSPLQDYINFCTNFNSKIKMNSCTMIIYISILKKYNCINF